MSYEGGDAQRLNDLTKAFQRLVDPDAEQFPDDTNWRAALELAQQFMNLFVLRVGYDMSAGSTIIGVTLEGLDIYVGRSAEGDNLAVTVDTSKLPPGVDTVVASNDGITWM